MDMNKKCFSLVGSCFFTLLEERSNKWQACLGPDQEEEEDTDGD